MVAGLPEDVKSRLPQDVLEQVQQQSNYYTDVQVVPEGGAEQTAGAMMLGGTPVQSADGATSEVSRASALSAG